jgi:hypothetical protein
MEVSQIIIHKADQPDVVLHFLDADGLARNDLSAVLRISFKNHSGRGRKSEKLPKDLETFV